MKLTFKIVISALLAFHLSGCSNFQFPWAYRIFVQQGNYVEEDMVEQLEVGMTPEQVRFVMGNALITDSFHPDRWDYYYNVRRGEKVIKEYHFKVFFENERVVSWEGDYQPSRKARKSSADKDKADSTGNSDDAESVDDESSPKNGNELPPQAPREPINDSA
ncbi:outer membrane protein assembly factor BamE [Teredinibacter waterburyi]|uniref:outer membrane protein assembly factor BamE n=1 Tax=Teredinibacter waterburyi TaxID=1500538 RepID=UPI00165F3ACA|nr:outer membrane protein assembly factor BamE [Teredinibacter waterburyi]